MIDLNMTALTGRQWAPSRERLPVDLREFQCLSRQVSRAVQIM